MNSEQHHPEVDAFIDAAPMWREELMLLRSMILSADILEEFKWRQPTYTVNGSNTIILSTRKHACVVGFFKGVLLNDPAGLMNAPGPHTQSARYASFTSVQHIKKHRKDILDLIAQAVRNENDGVRVALKSIEQHAVPQELQAVLDTRPDVHSAYTALTPGRRRQYLMHIGNAKQHSTRVARVEACIPIILAGKGLTDKQDTA